MGMYLVNSTSSDNNTLILVIAIEKMLRLKPITKLMLLLPVCPFICGPSLKLSTLFLETQ